MNAGGQGLSAARVDRTTTIVIALVLLGFVAVLARAVQMQVAPSEALKPWIDDRTWTLTERARRGDLLDRRGRLIASTHTGRRLFIDPHRFPTPPDDAIQKVAEASGVDASIIGERVMPRLAENLDRARAGRKPIRYVAIGDVLSSSRAEAVAALDVPGVHLETRSVRETPGEPLVASLAGKVGFEHTGLLGAEHALNDRLRETPGRLRVVHDATGSLMWIESGGLERPRDGDAVRLSVDLELQRVAKEELERGMEAANAAGGRLVMADPSTGEVLAMLDLYREVDAEPFDPETAPEGESGWPRYRVIPPDPRREVHPSLGRNRCVEDAYEPGSTFKPFIWSAALERDLARTDEVVETHGGRWRTDYGRLIEDVIERDRQTVRDVLVNSSNIGMTKLADRLTDRALQETVRKFGFGAPTRIGLPGESSGIVTPPERWNKYTRTSVAFGYEVAVTPVQMVRAFSAFARRGALAGTLPRLTLEAVDPGAERTGLVHRVLPDWTAHLARGAMRDVAGRMVNRAAQMGWIDREPSYTLFGKSGTARVPRPDGRGYFPEQYVSSFLAAAPAEDPRIVVLVVIDDPGPERIRTRSHYGSSVAGPVVANVVERALGYLGAPPSPETESAP